MYFNFDMFRYENAGGPEHNFGPVNFVYERDGDEIGEYAFSRKTEVHARRGSRTDEALAGAGVWWATLD